MEQRDKFLGVESIKFYSRFTNDDVCLEYLSAIKCAEGFKCKKCGHTNFCKGRHPFSRRCTRCKYDESVTSGTMFDKIKFQVLYAFHIAFKISTKKKGMSSMELTEEYAMRQKTVLDFKRKIQSAMQSSGNYPLEGVVHVDEFYGGGEEQGVTGRSLNGKKKLVIVALEIVPGGVERAYAQVIEDASADSFRSFFEKYISKDAEIVTDEWNGYMPLNKDYKKLEQHPSDKGKGLPEIHIHIMNIKGVVARNTSSLLKGTPARLS